MEIPPLFLKASWKTKCARCCGAFSLWTFFLRATMISKHESSNICAKNEISNSLCHAILSSFPLGSRCLSGTVVPDRRSDIMQDFTGLSLANTSRSWRGLWITSHRSFTRARGEWTRRPIWSHRAQQENMKFLHLHARLFMWRWSRSDLKDPHSHGGYMLKR